MLQEQALPLNRCPHCEVAKPNLNTISSLVTTDSNNRNPRRWWWYLCQSCGGVVLTVCDYDRQHSRGAHITDTWPAPTAVSEAVPDRARAFMEQAIASIHAPAGAVMLAASAVDSMLKEKGLKAGSLYKRIDEAAASHLITSEMAEWAHEVRLEANDQRHADEDAALPDEANARRVIEFATALAQFLFVLPARVAAGRGKPVEPGEAPAGA